MEQLFTFPTEELNQDVSYVSLAMELHADTLSHDKDSIQLENLVKEAINHLEGSDIDDKVALREQLNSVLDHRAELINATGGLAVYVTPDNFYYYHLAVPVESHFSVSDMPYVLPLLANFQYTREYHLLALDQDSIRIFEGKNGRLEEIDLSEYDNAPVDQDTALGTELDESTLTHGTYSGGSAQQTYHGHDDTNDQKEVDRNRYFQRVDDFVYRAFSNPHKKALVLYSVDENQSAFRDISSNEFLAQTSVNGSATGLATSEIEENVSKAIDELIAHQRNELFEELNETTPDNRIENMPNDLAAASLQGQIEKLYIEENFSLKGSITEQGQYDESSEKNDFVDRLIQNVIRTDGEVYVLDDNELPLDTPIAARLRY